MIYYIYILRCCDQSLYIGITNDLIRRYNEHLYRGKKAAKYTKSHQVISLEAYWTCDQKSSAAQLEYHLKKLKKKEKENIILDNSYFFLYLHNKLNLTCYLRGENDV